MLHITIPEREFFDEVRQEFVRTKGVSLQLEHSLVSLSKWESKWKKPFFGKEDKTNEEVLDYVRCMNMTQNVPPDIFSTLTADVFQQIIEYIHEPMTATWFNERPYAPKSKETITAELLYYSMIAQNIPMECQKWHLNRLLTLIQVCGIKNSPPKKMGRKEMLSQRRAINASRRAQMNSKG